MRDRQEPGAQGCIKNCGEEARDKGTQALFVARTTCEVLFSDYLLPHCLTDAGTAEDVRQGAAAH